MNTYSQIQEAVSKDKPSEFARLFENWFAATPHSEEKQTQVDSLLFQACARPASFGFLSGTPKIAAFLLQHGANPNAQDNDGNTPAMLSFKLRCFGSEGGFPDKAPTRRLLRTLFNYNIDTSLTNNEGSSLLMLAESEAFWNHRNGELRLLKTLIARQEARQTSVRSNRPDQLPSKPGRYGPTPR